MAKLAWATKHTKDGKYTVPSTIAEEKATNPFMRVRWCAAAASGVPRRVHRDSTSCASALPHLTCARCAAATLLMAHGTWGLRWQVREKTFQKYSGLTDPVEVLAFVRAAKDEFGRRAKK